MASVTRFDAGIHREAAKRATLSNRLNSIKAATSKVACLAKVKDRIETAEDGTDYILIRGASSSDVEGFSS